ncbi:hypothetical protein N7468_001407 [Penicillium chermesinum]|uniref:Uncharacterized protein n=1 Tax=Penicillium chermesinum TaxID=63820 RepID=A0A9W9PGG7_9EURO|nr:uncharacterized protein N7468_001407 [Penicillium chermesinum]KAJ5246424.1 hypothetical protein N7468_001407 [Penicillium chermesinum]
MTCSIALRHGLNPRYGSTRRPAFSARRNTPDADLPACPFGVDLFSGLGNPYGNNNNHHHHHHHDNINTIDPDSDIEFDTELDSTTTCSSSSRAVVEGVRTARLSYAEMSSQQYFPGFGNAAPDQTAPDPALVPYALNVPIRHTPQHQPTVIHQDNSRQPQSSKVSFLRWRRASKNSSSGSSSYDLDRLVDDPEYPFNLEAAESSQRSPSKLQCKSPPKTPVKGSIHKKLWGSDGLLGNPLAGAAQGNVPATSTPESPTTALRAPRSVSFATLQSNIPGPGMSPTGSPTRQETALSPGQQTSPLLQSPSGKSPLGGKSTGIFRGLSQRVMRRISDANPIEFPTAPQTPRRALAVTLSPKIQARLYLDLEMMVCGCANQFLIKQYRDGRLSQSSINKVHAKVRHQIMEFSYPQELQCELVQDNRRSLDFEGLCACNPVHLESTLRNWRSIAKEMSSRSFCLPDAAVRKHLNEIYWILDMLNAPTATLREFQSLNNMAHGTMLGSPGDPDTTPSKH